MDRVKNGEMRERERVDERGEKQERDENKANGAARATMAHRPAKTRAGAQKHYVWPLAFLVLRLLYQLDTSFDENDNLEVNRLSKRTEYRPV